MTEFVRRLIRAACVAYVLGLVIVIALFWFLGETWWPSLVAMYLPRWGWALPWPALTVALIISRQWRLMPLQLGAAALVLFPLMGLELAGPGKPASSPSLTVYTRNIHQGVDGLDLLMREIENANADIVVLQETRGKSIHWLRARFPRHNFHNVDEFSLLTRFAIAKVMVPPEVQTSRGKRNPRFVRYTLETPLGPIDVFNVHPISPRDALEDIRGKGLSHEIRSGRFFTDKRARRLVRPNTELRQVQVEAIGRLARESKGPVIIAGDTNLPGLSLFLRRYLGDFTDGFASRGVGFGYTFPAHRPWMRIDRILANDRLRFTSVSVGPAHGSDHRPVSAALVLAPEARR